MLAADYFGQQPFDQAEQDWSGREDDYAQQINFRNDEEMKMEYEQVKVIQDLRGRF